MADICPVCNKEVGLLGINVEKYGVKVHVGCNGAFSEAADNPSTYIPELTEEDEAIDESQSTSATNSPNITTPNASNSKVQVTNFDMPFEDMIKFMVKWALASIPAFIILFIIFGILFAIFGTLFF